MACRNRSVVSVVRKRSSTLNLSILCGCFFVCGGLFTIDRATISVSELSTFSTVQANLTSKNFDLWLSDGLRCDCGELNLKYGLYDPDCDKAGVHLYLDGQRIHAGEESLYYCGAFSGIFRLKAKARSVCKTRVCRGDISPGTSIMHFHHMRKCGGGELHAAWATCQGLPRGNQRYGIGNWIAHSSLGSTFKELWESETKRFYVFCDWPIAACELMKHVPKALSLELDDKGKTMETFIVLREPRARWYSSYKFFRTALNDFRLCSDYYVRWLRNTNFFETFHEQIGMAGDESVDDILRRQHKSIARYILSFNVTTDDLESAIENLAAYPVVCMLDRLDECNYFLKKYLQFDECMMERTGKRKFIHHTDQRAHDEAPTSVQSMVVNMNHYDVQFYSAASHIYDAQVYLERIENPDYENDIRLLKMRLDNGSIESRTKKSAESE